MLLLVFTTMLSFESGAAPPADKRTILTSGEKVYPIHYQLGQSTVLYFGLRPETVICGNKNYFNIEKIKDGLTVQPLSNYSTNLTILAQGRRYLFYLTPTVSGKPDGFVEVKWVPPGQTRPVKTLASHANELVTEIGQLLKISNDLELVVLREKAFDKGKRRIFELELKNTGSKNISSEAIEIVASIGGVPIERQVVAWENETVNERKTIRGRVIVSGAEQKSLNLIVGYKGKNTKIMIKGGRH